MGTRGFVGFVVDGTEKITYNHYDSYPSGLGRDVLAWLWGNDHDEVKALAQALRVVDEDATKPTDEDIEQLKQYLNSRVDFPSERPSWYQLLCETQGKPDRILAAGVLVDASSFPRNSLFAEWGYLVDFDSGTFEAYQGFQREPHGLGRFADREGQGGYAPVALAGSWPLSELPDEATFLSTLEPSDEDAD